MLHGTVAFILVLAILIAPLATGAQQPSGTPAALAAKHATTTIPIVIGFVGEPVGSGIVASLARPGGNITGWTHLVGLELAGKRLELIKETVPGVTRIGTLWNPANPGNRPFVKELEAAAQALKVQLHPVGVQDPKEIDRAFAALARQRTEALAVVADGMFLAQRDRIIALAARSRRPAMYPSAKALGLTIPPSPLLKADRIIE